MKRPRQLVLSKERRMQDPHISIKPIIIKYSLFVMRKKKLKTTNYKIKHYRRPFALLIQIKYERNYEIESYISTR